MKEFNFELIFKLVDNQDSNEYLDALFAFIRMSNLF